jgi:hypothetical protein
MADKKISQLTGATTPLAGTEVLPIVQGGSTVKVSVANLTAGRAVSADSASLAQRLQIGSSDTTYAIEVGDTAAGSSGNLFRFIRSTTEFGAFISSGVPFFGTLTSNDFSLITNSTSRARIFASGGISVGDTTDPGAGNLRVGNGNLVVGTAAKGIDFSANTHAAGMTSELLNWYEEGTWTPAYTNATPPTTPYTMTVSSATYTRIGRQVTVRAWIYTQNVDTTGASGALQISGLPFAAAAGSAGYSAMAIGQARGWAIAPSYGYVDGSAISLMYRTAANVDDDTALAANLTTGASANKNQLIFTATYFV